MVYFETLILVVSYVHICMIDDHQRLELATFEKRNDNASNPRPLHKNESRDPDWYYLVNRSDRASKRAGRDCTPRGKLDSAC